MAYSYPLVNVGDRFLVTLNGSLLGQVTMSTFVYRCVAHPVGESQEQAMTKLLDALDDAGKLIPDFISCCPPNWTLASVWIQPIAPTRSVKKVYAGGAAGGFGVTPAETANLAAVIVRRGVAASRKAISTLHVPIANDANALADGFLSAALLIPLSALADEIEVSPSKDGYTFNPVIHNGPAAQEYTNIGDASTRDTIRVMRRRTVGLGI